MFPCYPGVLGALCTRANSLHTVCVGSGMRLVRTSNELLCCRIVQCDSPIRRSTGVQQDAINDSDCIAGEINTCIQKWLFESVQIVQETKSSVDRSVGLKVPETFV